MKFGFNILILHLGWYLVVHLICSICFCVGMGNSQTMYEVNVQMVDGLLGA